MEMVWKSGFDYGLQHAPCPLPVFVAEFKELKKFVELATLREREEIAKLVEPWLLPEYVEKIRTRKNK